MSGIFAFRVVCVVSWGHAYVMCERVIILISLFWVSWRSKDQSYGRSGCATDSKKTRACNLYSNSGKVKKKPCQAARPHTRWCIWYYQAQRMAFRLAGTIEKWPWPLSLWGSRTLEARGYTRYDRCCWNILWSCLFLIRKKYELNWKLFCILFLYFWYLILYVH